jgi:hypothetical protein
MSNCYICSHELTDNIYFLSSCDHGYHPTCLLDFFYTNKTTFCPCCMNELEMHMSIESNKIVDFANASRCARKKDAPKSLVKLYKNYKDLYLKQKENAMEIRTFNTEDGPIFRPLQKRIRGLRRKKRMLKRKIKYMKKKICEIAIS